VSGGPTSRLFVCVDPSPAAVADLGAVVDGLEVAKANTPGHSTRLAARDRWHVTLAFLGDVPVQRVDKAGAALAAAAAGYAGVRPTLRFAGGGTFGRGGLTILWAGLAGDLDALRALAAGVRAQLRGAHLPFDGKPFRPHLTISRPGARVPSELLSHDVETLQEYVGPQWTVGELHLVGSELGPHPVYTTVRSVELAIGPASPAP
jgi:RNA 2',3'-cyclic 3'-phosphodiesterase